jgi:hypothetical protein
MILVYISSITIFNPMVPATPHATITGLDAHWLGRSHSNTFLPGAHHNRTGSVYRRWVQFTQSRRSGRITSPATATDTGNPWKRSWFPFKIRGGQRSPLWVVCRASGEKRAPRPRPRQSRQNANYRLLLVAARKPAADGSAVSRHRHRCLLIERLSLRLRRIRLVQFLVGHASLGAR